MSARSAAVLSAARPAAVVRLVAALLVTIAAAPRARAEGPSAPRDLYAIVVGHNGGDAQLPALRHADDDAVRFAALFRGLGARRVWLLASPDAETRAQLARAGLAAEIAGAPTRRAVLGAFEAAAREIAARRSGPPPSLYVLYAGHGLRGRVLLQPESAPTAALTGDELRAALADVADADARARLFVFLDACRSQSLFSERGAADDVELGEALRALDRRSRAVEIGILTAARTGRPAGEVAALGAGYFSHVLTSALAGAADADGDERISFGELAAFVAFHTQKLTGQQPWFDPPGGDLRADALDHRGRRPRIELLAEGPGRLLVHAAAGGPVFAEAFKAPSRPLRLVLPAGSYRVQRLSGPGGAQEVAVELGPGAAVSLDRLAWQESRAPAARARGEDPESASASAPLAFAEPFSSEIVSTLAAGYDAGRSPRSEDAAPTSLFAAAELSRAPLGLAALATGLTLAARREVGPLSFGLRGFFASSRHPRRADAFALRRFGAELELGLPLPLARRVTARPWIAAGLAATMRAGRGRTAGDPLGPIASIGASGEWRLLPRLGLFAELRYAAHWIEIDDARRRSGGPAGALGASTWF